MTNHIASLAKPFAPRGATLPRMLAQIHVQWLSWRRRRRDQTALERQPDYLLKDIGIERHEIDRALRGRFY
jgi:uncharacterized protein YjiS (DUF1127 family)